MAQRTVVRTYRNYRDAEAVVTELEAAGVPNRDISLVANADAHGRAVPADGAKTEGEAGTGAGTGATLGTLLGGGAGLLAGIGSLAIPGVGPVVAAGWLVATLAGAGVGAASGGLAGGLIGAGVSRSDADAYAEEVKQGGSMVSVRADEAEMLKVEAIMMKHGSAEGPRPADAPVR